ncbi:MAG: hypothetical protein F4Z62_01180 [Rhodothermaceae bacterium]|nr:hypothetical protein [Rhodothermaceae bacterium]
MKTIQKMRVVLCIWFGMFFAVIAFAQSRLEMCQSNLRVTSGTTVVIDCGGQTQGNTYRWTSSDPSWLTHLSDVDVASPHFHAPVNVELPLQLKYERLTFDGEGELLDQAFVMIIVQESQGSGSGRIKDRRLGERGWIDLDRMRIEGSWTGSREELAGADDAVSDRVPFLRCRSPITVGSGELVEIPCTGLHPSGGLLEYRVEFDWPPYSETKILGDGSFEYAIRAPEIQGAASVQILEIFAEMPGTGHLVSERIELHVVNRTPKLLCEDVMVDEGGEEIDVPCSVMGGEAARIQILSELMPLGIHSDWPMIPIPEVGRDTSFTVTTRVFGAEGGSVVEADFVVRVRQASIPLNFDVNCDSDAGGLSYVEYEGAAVSELTVSCEVEGEVQEKLVWIWSALGATPWEPLLDGIILDDDMKPTVVKFSLLELEEVNTDVSWSFSLVVTADESDGGGVARKTVDIKILEKPDISIACESAQVRTGDPPLKLECTPSLDMPHRDQPLKYEWTWDSENGLGLLSGDLDSGMPVFNVPEDQDPPTVEYTYQVTASAENTDPPQNPTTLTVTVEKYLGKLALGCTSPIELYAGDPDYPLECVISNVDVTDPEWTWQLQEGPQDRLIAGAAGAPPIFQPPESVAAQETYKYNIQVSAPFYDASESESVEIIVLKRPVLSLDCPEEVVVTVGMPPQRIMCSVTNDQDLALEYAWQWMPTERLSDSSTGSPLFDVPLSQRSYSRTYPYTVTVSAEHAISAEASVDVIVLDPSEEPEGQLEVSSSALDFGVAHPAGEVSMDPATQQLSGMVYEMEQSNVGRMMIQARDSVTVSVEHLQSAVLRHVDSGRELALLPRIAYSPSCTMFAANAQASRIVQTLLEPGDCHVLRIGGTIALAQAEPGVYSGRVSIVLTVNGLDQLHTVPVELTVEPQRRVVLLGPDGVRFRAAQSPMASLGWEQHISIQPQVAILDHLNRTGTFELTNPSIYPMEVEVSTEFGYREAQGEERFSVGVTDQEVSQGDLSAHVTVYPRIILLSPGESQPVHYAIPDHAQMQSRGYAGQFNFTVTSREFIDQTQSPTSVQAARITFQAPGVYIPGPGPAVLRASVESTADEAVVILIETATIPFYGEVIVSDDSGDELGRSELLVYTRSRVRIPLKSTDVDGFTLRFESLTPNQRSPSDVHIPSDF